MKKRQLAALGCAALAALVGVGAERTADGYGLVNALAGYTVTSGDPWPFYYYAAAIEGGSGSQSTSVNVNRDNPNTWAPACIYQLERYAKTINTTFSGLVPNATYKVELHLIENYFGGSNGGTGTGARVWNVALNGVTAESNIDIFTQAGGAYKALCKQYETTANASGQIVVGMTTVKDNGHFSGMAVFGTAAPSAVTFAATHTSVDVDLTFSGKDVHRFYVQKAASESGPWTQVGVYEPHLTSGRLSAAYDPSVSAYYRVVASNGVGTVASSVVSFTASGATDHLATTGSTVADKPAAIYAVDTVGDPAAGHNVLGADDVTVTSYKLAADGDSVLDLLADQTFTVGVLGVDDFARKLTVQGDGTLVAKDGILSFSVGTGAEVEVASALNGGNGILNKTGSGRVTLAGPVSAVASLVASEGELIVSNATDGALDPVVSGAGTFVKAGPNTLTLTNALPNLSGDFVVREGTLRFGKTGSLLPDTTGRLVIEDGAALDVSSGLANYGVVLGARKVVVSGAGPDGKGAIVNNAGDCQYSALRVGELAGDVVFGGTLATRNETNGRWDFRGSGGVGSFAMNGHNIRKIGKNMVCLTGIALTEGGTVHIDVDEGYWSSETTTTYAGGPANAFNIASGATLDFYSMSNPITWAANLADGAEIKFRAGTAVQNRMTGPVTLAAGAGSINAVGGYMGSITGPISGPGMLKSVSGANGRVTLTGTNTYEGGTWIQGGDLWAERRESLPGYDVDGKLVVTNGSLLVRAENGYWSESDVQGIADRGALKASGSYLGAYVNAGVTTTWTAPFSLSYGHFVKDGDGTLVLGDALSVPNGYYETRGGSLVLDGANANEAKMLRVRMASTLALTNGASATISVASGSNSLVGDVINKQATLVVGKDSTLAGPTDCAVNVASAGLLIGNSSGTGLLVVDGGTVKHKVNTGIGSTQSQGSVIQNGGLVENQGGASNDIRVGEAGYGYYELNGGELDWWGYGTIGCNAGAYGVMVQHDGLFKFVGKTSGRFGLGRGGDGTFYMDGGEVDFSSGSCFLAVGEQDSSTAGAGSQTSFTVDGTGLARFNTTSAMAIGNRKDHMAAVNLNGGVLQGAYFAANTVFNDTNRTTLVSLLNFNGGTFRSAGNNNLVTTQTYKRLDAVTVYAGGAVFDPAGFTEVVNMPLERPAGNGVASIDVPSGLASATWLVGAPHVKITGGGGRGATAVCMYDAATRKVTGVKVTCPGTGYTEAPTVTFHGGGRTNVFTGTATIAANAVTGGLTVRSSTGTGAVRLSAANTFGGPVKVESGTLQLEHAEGFPVGADLVLEGGVFNAMGHTVTAGVVTVRGGTFANGTLVCKKIVKEGAGDFTLDGARVDATRIASGLWAGKLAGAFNVSDPNPCTEIVAAPDRANLRTGWGENETWVYTGYIWNRGETDATWTFSEYFDDAVLLKIDGVTLMNGTSWSSHMVKTVTLSPGPHEFELRLGQGTGGAGPSTYADSYDLPIAKPWGDNLMGLGIDFQGRNTGDYANFVKFEDYENVGELFTYMLPGVQVAEGRIVVHGSGGPAGAGLFEGMLSGASNWSDPNPCTAVTLTTTKANTQSGWSEQVTAVYSGYIWNRTDADVTWTFAENFDDYARLWIDDALVLSGASWNDIVLGTVTLTPGPHKFEARFGQAAGGAGPSTNTADIPQGWANKIGFAVDYQGRGERVAANFEFPIDPGDGSLFTTYTGECLDPFGGEVEIADGAQLVVAGMDEVPVGILHARGLATNGTVKVTETLLASGADLAAGRHLTVTAGGFALAEGATVKVDGFDALEKGAQYVLAEAADGVTLPAQVTLVGAPANTAWTVYRRGRTLVLGYPSGGVIYLR